MQMELPHYGLDIYRNGQRQLKHLKHLKLAKPSNVKDREENKKLLQQAEAIRLPEQRNWKQITITW